MESIYRWEVEQHNSFCYYRSKTSSFSILGSREDQGAHNNHLRFRKVFGNISQNIRLEPPPPLGLDPPGLQIYDPPQNAAPYVIVEYHSASKGMFTNKLWYLTTLLSIMIMNQKLTDYLASQLYLTYWNTSAETSIDTLIRTIIHVSNYITILLSICQN